MVNDLVLHRGPQLPVHVPDEIWYRYDDVRYAPPLDEYDNIVGTGRIELRLQTFKVMKHTPKGVWLGYWWDHDRGKLDYGNLRFVRHDAHKRYACATKALALESFKARKRKQASIYKARMLGAERALELAEKEKL